MSPEACPGKTQEERCQTVIFSSATIFALRAISAVVDARQGAAGEGTLDS